MSDKRFEALKKLNKATRDEIFNYAMEISEKHILATLAQDTSSVAETQRDPDKYVYKPWERNLEFLDDLTKFCERYRGTLADYEIVYGLQMVLEHFEKTSR